MTRFVGDAKDVREGRKKLFPTTKDMKKNMEIYKRTGRHPALEGNRNSDSLPPLPERDMNRPHIFIDVQQGNDTLGRLVVEVFEDQAPLAARHLINRCREGTTDTLQLTSVHRLLPDMAMFFGTSRGYKGSGVRVRRYERLHHNHAGVVSLSGDGSEVAISLTKALSLDSGYQVVGRVHKGLEILEKINESAVDPDDLPLQRITITSCGLTDAQGTHESLEEAARREAQKKETPQEAAVRLQAESKRARDSVKDALQSGLSHTRTGGERAGSSVRQSASKRSMLADVLGDLSDDEDSADDSNS
ncbi:probable peptidyl-prolyl cis-trans isomerase E [Coccomyxa sp. Obi]|nr:probable peptidyl-prolyl cis-trans isomerase E [Coccomyxa sp. Obi]